MAITPEMLKKLKGKAPALSGMKPKGAEIEIKMGKPGIGSGDGPDMSHMEGSPEEESAESPDEAMAEGDDQMGGADQGMPDLSDIPTGVLQAELEKRQANGADDSADGQDDGGDPSSYFKESDQDHMS